MVRPRHSGYSTKCNIAADQGSEGVLEQILSSTRTTKPPHHAPASPQTIPTQLHNEVHVQSSIGHLIATEVNYTTNDAQEETLYAHDKWLSDMPWAPHQM
jgi:hypothetical protein